MANTDSNDSTPPTYTQSTTAVSTPPTYTDNTVISVKIPIADLEDSDSEDQPPPSNGLRPPPQQPRRKSWIAKLKPKSKGEKIVLMTRGDYHRYWARDARGNYIGTEPEGEGRRVMRRKRLLQMQEAHPQRGAPVAGDTKDMRAEAQFDKVTGSTAAQRGEVSATQNLPAGMEERWKGEYRETGDPLLGGAKMKAGNGFRPRPGSEFAPVGYLLGGMGAGPGFGGGM